MEKYALDRLVHAPDGCDVRQLPARYGFRKRPAEFANLFLCSILLVILAGTNFYAFSQSQADEYRVKAAFLFHFAQLVEWPTEIPGDPNRPFNICTLGEDSFRGELEDTVGGKSIGTRTVQVRHFKQPQEALGCQILFIGSSEDKRLSTILAEIDSNPVMTVGEADDFVEQGGIIRFFLEDNKIRFDINLKPADKAGLKISSRLLLLAKNVSGGRKGG
jgi:hypothetical protein